MNSKHLAHTFDGMTLRRQSQTQISLHDLLSLVWALIKHVLVNLVHGTISRELILLDKVLNSAVLLELLPVVVIIENLIHRDCNFATRLAHHAWVIVFSSIIIVTLKLDLPPVIDYL